MSVTSRIISLDGVKAEVESEWYNSLIGRREIVLRVDHVLASTPSRYQLRQAISRIFNIDIGRVYVRSVRTEYGVGVSRAVIHVYDSVERALAFEPRYVIERNGGVNPGA